MISVKYKNADLKLGDTLKVKTTVVEGNKTRVQTFEGHLISIKGRGDDKTFKVRRVGAKGIGVERTWPLNAKSIVDILVAKHAKKVRRAKLFFLRKVTGRAAVNI